MITATDLITAHPFQTKGMGVAPYQFVTVISIPSSSLAEANPDAYRNGMSDCMLRARALGVTLCTCEYCGMSLTHNYIIRDSAKKHFVVGCDCVMKTGDTELITLAEAARRQIQQEKNAALRIARDEARAARWNAALEAEIARYGMTIEELRSEALEASRSRRDMVIASITWGDLLETLNAAPKGNGAFLTNILEEINVGRSLADIPERAAEILGEVYARQKSGKTKRAAEFQEAYTAYWDTFAAAEEAENVAMEAWYAENRAIEAATRKAKAGGDFVIVPGTK